MKKNDKIRNGFINCFNESPCLTSNNPSLRGMRVRRRGKRDYGARERARNMMLDRERITAGLKNFVVQKRDRC